MIWRAFKVAVVCMLCTECGVLSARTAVVAGCALFTICSIHSEKRAERANR